MSDPSHIPPGNRPPTARVFRPFAGGSAGQGSQSPAAVPDARGMDRRPTQPRRPFAGIQLARSPEPVLVPDDHAPLPPLIEVSQAPDIAAPAPPLQTMVAEGAAWSRIVEAAPVELDWPRDPIGEDAALGDGFEGEATPEVTADLLAISEETPAPSFVEPTVTVPEKAPVVTAEVPAIASVEPDPLDAPLFVAPGREPAAESLIDEVDAAFITAGLPSSGEASASDDAVQAAASLEGIARRLRAGNIALRPASGARMSSDVSALATVLAALLADR